MCNQSHITPNETEFQSNNMTKYKFN